MHKNSSNPDEILFYDMKREEQEHGRRKEKEESLVLLVHRSSHVRELARSSQYTVNSSPSSLCHNYLCS